ncbi:nucleotidyltransferase domain-containing protein [Pedobacter sp. MC2016-05]|nr:nucleotidyltransferase domain-containing protein [Pedobacter sp. MC2016-05]MCX2474121.1 nucleotidyltransferase domain-containing protein [Pedobacter sp. MC2016-05]
MGVFGSFTTDRITEDSDIDFLVEFDPSKKALIILLSCLST